MQLGYLTFFALAGLVPTILANCESGGNHHLGDSCYGKTGNTACSGNDGVSVSTVLPIIHLRLKHGR
jgi:hypothetical protein